MCFMVVVVVVIVVMMLEGSKQATVGRMSGHDWGLSSNGLSSWRHVDTASWLCQLMLKQRSQGSSVGVYLMTILES